MTQASSTHQEVHLFGGHLDGDVVHLPNGRDTYETVKGTYVRREGSDPRVIFDWQGLRF